MEENKDNKGASKPAEKKVEIVPVFPEGQLGMFSNFATIQRDRKDFHLSFFQIHPPVIIGDDQRVDETFNSIQSVDAQCLARIVMSEDRIRGLITALTDQLKKSEPTIDLPVVTEENHTPEG